jgi:hypothetical protein
VLFKLNTASTPITEPIPSKNKSYAASKPIKESLGGVSVGRKEGEGGRRGRKEGGRREEGQAS